MEASDSLQDVFGLNFELFTSNGKPLEFLLDGYGEEKFTDIANIVEAFGGRLSTSLTSNTLVFCDPRYTSELLCNRYDIKFLQDSIEAQKLQKLENYRLALSVERNPKHSFKKSASTYENKVENSYVNDQNKTECTTSETDEDTARGGDDIDEGTANKIETALKVRSTSQNKHFRGRNYSPSKSNKSIDNNKNSHIEKLPVEKLDEKTPGDHKDYVVCTDQDEKSKITTLKTSATDIQTENEVSDNVSNEKKRPVVEKPNISSSPKIESDQGYKLPPSKVKKITDVDDVINNHNSELATLEERKIEHSKVDTFEKYAKNNKKEVRKNTNNSKKKTPPNIIFPPAFGMQKLPWLNDYKIPKAKIQKAILKKDSVNKQKKLEDSAESLHRRTSELSESEICAKNFATRELGESKSRKIAPLSYPLSKDSVACDNAVEDMKRKSRVLQSNSSENEATCTPAKVHKIGDSNVNKKNCETSIAAEKKESLTHSEISSSTSENSNSSSSHSASDDESQRDLTPHGQSSGQGARNQNQIHHYTEDEKRCMIEYLIKKKAIHRASLRSTWKEFLKYEILQGYLQEAMHLQLPFEYDSRHIVLKNIFTMKRHYFHVLKEPKPSCDALCKYFMRYVLRDYEKYTDDVTALKSFKAIRKFKSASTHYSEHENRRMMQYIIENNAIERAGGFAVWQDFLDGAPNESNRTAVALGAHFYRYLLPNYRKYTDDPVALREFEKKTILKRKSRMPWSKEENQVIINFLIDNNHISNLGQGTWLKCLQSSLLLQKSGRTSKAIESHFYRHLRFHYSKYTSDKEALKQFKDVIAKQPRNK